MERGDKVPEKEIINLKPQEVVMKKLMKTRRKLSILVPTVKSGLKTKEKSMLIIETDIPRTFAYLPEMVPLKQSL